MSTRGIGSPFASDMAREWLAEIQHDENWDAVIGALHGALSRPRGLRAEDAIVAIAAADVVAQAVSSRWAPEPERSTIEQFISRAGQPPPLVVAMADDAMAVATGTRSALYEIWAEGDAADWVTHNAIIARGLRGEGGAPPGSEYVSDWGDPVGQSPSKLLAYSWNALLTSACALLAALVVVFVMTLAGANEARLWASGLGGIAIILMGGSIGALGIAHVRASSYGIGFGLSIGGLLLVIGGATFRWYFGYELGAL